MNVDVCLWTKNGAATLPKVLNRIDAVVPYSQKIAVDDSSTDNTVKLLKQFNYEVFRNRRGFINGGTNQALSHVNTEFFVGVEQDVLLCPGWFNKLFHYMEKDYVAVVQGVEYSTCRSEHSMEEIPLKCAAGVNVFLKSQFWHSIGNNIYRTEAIRNLGFVSDRVRMDSFFKRVCYSGYVWITDDKVVSAHLHGNLLNSLKHTRTLYGLSRETSYMDGLSKKRFLLGFAASPAKGFAMALETRNPFVLAYHVAQKFPLWQALTKQHVRVSRPL